MSSTKHLLRSWSSVPKIEEHEESEKYNKGNPNQKRKDARGLTAREALVQTQTSIEERRRRERQIRNLHPPRSVKRIDSILKEDIRNEERSPEQIEERACERTEECEHEEIIHLYGNQMSVLFLLLLDGQALAPLPAPARQYFPAIGRFASLAESMLSKTPAPFELIEHCCDSLEEAITRVNPHYDKEIDHRLARA